MSVMRRLRAAVTAGLAITTLVACGSDVTPGDRDTDMMRERTVEAFEDSDPSVAELASDDGTRPHPIDTPFLDDWYVFVLSGRHRQSAVAVTKEGDPAGVNLSADPDGWGQVVDGVQVADATVATQVVDAWTEATRPTTGAAYYISSVADIKGLGADDATTKETAARLEDAYGTEVADQELRTEGEGWATTRWLVVDNALTRLDLVVAKDATVTSTSTTVERGLPGPIPL